MHILDKRLLSEQKSEHYCVNLVLLLDKQNKSLLKDSCTISMVILVMLHKFNYTVNFAFS